MSISLSARLSIYHTHTHTHSLTHATTHTLTHSLSPKLLKETRASPSAHQLPSHHSSKQRPAKMTAQRVPLRRTSRPPQLALPFLKIFHITWGANLQVDPRFPFPMAASSLWPISSISLDSKTELLPASSSGRRQVAVRRRVLAT